jgi:hypothetical protein
MKSAAFFLISKDILLECPNKNILRKKGKINRIPCVVCISAPGEILTEVRKLSIKLRSDQITLADKRWNIVGLARLLAWVFIYLGIGRVLPCILQNNPVEGKCVFACEVLVDFYPHLDKNLGEQP